MRGFISVGVAALCVLCTAPAKADPPGEACTVPNFKLTPVAGRNAFSFLSLLMGDQGKTTLRVVVDKNGVPSDVSIDTPSGSSRLDNWEMNDVRKNWRWSPYQGDCEKSGVLTKVQIVWPSTRYMGPKYLALYAVGDDYPADAQKKEEEGAATVTTHISEKGAFQDARITSSTGYADLDAKSVEIVSHLKFAAGTVAGQPTDTVLTIYVLFVLGGPPVLPNTGITPIPSR